jgi:hypothetical protein
VREGTLYIKGVVFPSFAFLHPLSSHTHLFIPSYTSSFNMTSYTEEFLRAAREASGPSIRDIELIRCFQARPTTKDAVHISFCSFNSILSNILLFFLSRTECPFTWIPELLRGLYIPLITT